MVGVNGAAEKIYKTIKVLSESDFLTTHNGTTNLGLSAVPTTRNIDHILEVVDYALKIGAFPCMGELESEYDENSYQQLAVSRERRQQLQSDIKAKYGFVYERPLCQGVFCGLHVKENGD